MSGADHGNIKSLLAGHPIVDAIAKRPLVFLPSSATVGQLLELLSAHGILSAPIFRAGPSGAVDSTSLSTLLGFADVWAVLVAFLQSLPAAASCNGLTAEQLEAHGAELCQRPVLSLFDNQPNIQAALQSGGEPHITCADWEMSDDPNTSLLDIIRTCFLPRMPPPGSGLVSYGSGVGPMATPGPNMSPRVSNSSATGGNSVAQNAPPASPLAGHSRHPAASHRIVVSLPDGAGGDTLVVLSQSDILRFLAAHSESLRPLGKASLAELGLASGSLHLAAGPPTATCARPPPLSPAGGHASPFTSNSGWGSGGAGSGGSGAALPGGGVPSSPKPPLARGSLDLGAGASSGGILGTSPNTILGSSPGGGGGGGDSSAAGQMMAAGLARGPSGSSSGPAMMQMSPPASPRVSAASHGHLLGRGSSLGGAAGHRNMARRQLVAVHESVPVLEAFKVLLQQRVSAVAVLAGTGPSPNLRLVGNLSASDLRHLRKGGFGGLALTVKAFLASKPLAPDQAIRVSPPPPVSSSAAAADAASGSAGSAAAGAPRPPSTVIMAHAPSCFTCQATASLDELIRLLGGRCAGIHRVYVVDPDQRPAGVVTTTDVLQLLSTACSRE